MKLTKQKSIFLALVVLFSVVVAPTIIRVQATSQDAVIGDITWEDIGAEGHYTFANVTYNTDGTGTDVLDASSVGIGASVESISNPQASFSGKLHTAMGFGIYADKPELVASQYQLAGAGASISSGPQLYTYETLSGFWSDQAGAGASVGVTNGTTSEELFSYNEKDKYDTGNHNFADNFDTDSNWWNTNVSTAANAFNVSSEYQALNDSLTDTTELDIDNYFNNAGENKESGIRANTMEHLKGETFVVGYEDAEEGIINDLRAYLALLQSVDYAKIVITDYNISTAKISYNMSEALTGKIRTAVDYWRSEASSESSLYLGIMGIPLFKIGTASARLGGSGSDLIASIGSTLNNVGKSVKSGFVSFGTTLKQFGARTQDILTGSWNTVRNTASDAYQTVGGTIKSALSGASKTLKTGANFIVDIGKSAIKTGQTIVGKAVHVVQSFGSSILKLLTNPLLLILLIAVICVVGYIVLKKTEMI